MYEIKLDWYGKQRTAEIRRHVNRGIIKATQFLLRRTVEKISVWGSEFITTLRRKRIKHSSPGSPPYSQTGNLGKSLKYYITTDADGYNIGGVYSDEAYAETVEKGGSTQIDQSQKRFTPVRLVNPIKKAITIAARPFMRPTLRENTAKLVEIIRRG